MKAKHWDGPALPDGIGVYRHGNRVDCEELFLWIVDPPAVWAEGNIMVVVEMRGEDYIGTALSWAREVCGYPEETGHCYDSARLEGIEWRNGDEIPIPLRILGIEIWSDGENPDWDVTSRAGPEIVKNTYFISLVSGFKQPVARIKKRFNHFSFICWQ